MKKVLASELPHWKLAYRNLARHSRRTIATGIAIVFGFSGLLLLGAYIHRTDEGLRASAVYINLRGHVAIRKTNSLERFSGKPARFALTLEDQRRIEGALEPIRDDVEYVGRFLTGPALLTDPKHSTPVYLTGVDPSLYPKLLAHPNVLRWAKDWLPAGVADQMAKMTTDASLISITMRLAEKLDRGRGHDLNVGSDPGVQIMGKNYFGDLNVVEAKLGLQHATGVAQAEDTSVVAPIRLLQDLYATDGVEYVALFLKNHGDSQRIARELRASLGSDYEIYTYADERWSPQYVGTATFIRVMMIFFTVLILGGVALATANTITLNLLERLQEVGTLRAIGFDPSATRAAFLRESTILCGLCLLLGASISGVIGSTVNMMDIRFMPPGSAGEIQFRLGFSLPISVMMSASMFVIVLVATYFVVRTKSRVKIVDLLNDTGA